MNKVKRESSIAFTPVIKHTSLTGSLQNTQIRERKLEENGVVELDRDEFALQRFLKVQGELIDLEAILMKGKKRHVFEQIKRNAATKPLRGVEKVLAENEATPTPSGRPTTLQEGTTGKQLVNEQLPDVVSKVVNMTKETSQRAPAFIQDAPSIPVSSKENPDRSQKHHRSDHGAIHPSRRYVYDHSEGSQSHEKSQPALPGKLPKRKELPGMGLIFNPRPNPTQDDKKHKDKGLPRNLQRREVDIPEVKDTVEETNDADIENAIDSAQNWLQHENTLEQEDRRKRWVANPNWKRLTADQIDAMRRQSSIPPSRFYGHRPKWRTQPGWRQLPVTETPTTTLARVDKILAKVKKEQRRSHSHPEKKMKSCTGDENKKSATTGSKDLTLPKATSSSREEKGVMNAVGYEFDSQPSTRDGRPAVEPQIKPAGDTVETSKVKAMSKKRKRDTDVSETAVTASTMKNVSESPDLPSIKEIIEGKQMAVTSSPAKKKKSKECSDPGAVEGVVNDAREPSTPSRSKKRKKAKETLEVYEVAGEGNPKTTKKRRKSGETQETDEAVIEKPRTDTLVDRLRKIKKNEKALALQEATRERSQTTIPTPEAAKTNKLDRTPQTAPEPAVEDIWQPIVDDEDPISSPQPARSSKRKHKSKHRRQANNSPTVAADDTTPETIKSPAPALPSNSPTRSSFNHLRRRHQSLPLRLPPNTASPTANPNTIPPQPQPPPDLYDLNLLAIRARLSNLEAAVAANPAPPNPNSITPLAALKLRFPPLPRAVPPGTTRLSDAELIEIGKRINGYERHTGAPYAFSWRGRLYAEYDYLMDLVDNRGRAGWDFKEKARLKTS